jgi:hypothetical protein
VEIELDHLALARLLRPVNGQGGFQQLLRKLQSQLNGSILTINADDAEKLERYSYSYGLGGFQDRTAPTTLEVQQVLNFEE